MLISLYSIKPLSDSNFTFFSISIYIMLFIVCIWFFLIWNVYLDFDFIIFTAWQKLNFNLNIIYELIECVRDIKGERARNCGLNILEQHNIKSKSVEWERERVVDTKSFSYQNIFSSEGATLHNNEVIENINRFLTMTRNNLMSIFDGT